MAIGIGTFSSLLSAQQAFDGFNFQLGLGATQSQINGSNTNDRTILPNASINGSSSATRLNGLASIGYSQSFDNLFKGFNLAANIFYVIGDQSAGNESNTTNGVFANNGRTPITETLTASYKVKNTWGISLEPGYYINENFLGYLKFAYVSSSASVSATCSSSDGGCLRSDGSYGFNSSLSIDKTIYGVGYGAGGKYHITKEIYAALDFLYVDYSKINQTINWAGSPTNASFKPQQFMGFVSIGYKF